MGSLFCLFALRGQTLACLFEESALFLWAFCLGENHFLLPGRGGFVGLDVQLGSLLQLGEGPLGLAQYGIDPQKGHGVDRRGDQAEHSG